MASQGSLTDRVRATGSGLGKGMHVVPLRMTWPGLTSGRGSRSLHTCAVTATPMWPSGGHMMLVGGPSEYPGYLAQAGGADVKCGMGMGSWRAGTHTMPAELTCPMLQQFDTGKRHPHQTTALPPLSPNRCASAATEVRPCAVSKPSPSWLPPLPTLSAEADVKLLRPTESLLTLPAASACMGAADSAPPVVAHPAGTALGSCAGAWTIRPARVRAPGAASSPPPASTCARCRAAASAAAACASACSASGAAVR
eukprot:284157-Chlamydomonas_euryale.AAC.9